jgi:hypothetical protein
MLNTNPSYVFFRELPRDLPGPLGAQGVPLTPERSIAVDARVRVRVPETVVRAKSWEPRPPYFSTARRRLPGSGRVTYPRWRAAATTRGYGHHN